MSLSGTLSTMPFADLLQWLGDSRRSGVLTVALELEERHLELSRGELVALGSSDPLASDMAQIALSRGLADRAAIEAARARQARTSRPLAEILIEDGHVARDALRAAARSHAKDAVVELFLWDEGRFVFSDEADRSIFAERIEGDGCIRLDPPLPARELLMDGMRRLDEWRSIAQAFPSDYTIVHALGRAPDLPALEALAACGEPLALGDLCLRMLRPRFDVVRELHRALERSLLAVEPLVPQLEGSAEPAGAADGLVASAAILLGERQFDEAGALLRSALHLDPFHAGARDLLRRARSEQLAALYQELPP